MGMDLYSIKNDDYFRANVWSWRPIWRLVATECEDFLPEEAYESGSVNDGYEINEKMALKIHDKLKSLNIPKIIKEYHYYLDNLPLEDCKFCDATGYRNDENVKGDCNACNTEYTRAEGIPKGKDRNFQYNYRMDKEHIEEFIDFCKTSKGFKIC